ncbi:MAG: LytTR family transcriptional regulator [Proteobacteria bacterium]|nr:LytTR family transcriptional regulator [Pseudomonadota bacterium]
MRASQPITKTQAGKTFLDRLPHALGNELICFVMEDHYLKVATTKGEQMLLMRMKDVLVELADYDGLQVHRSWWVARDAVARTKKNGRNLILILENDIEVPVSRTFLKKVKEAGLF